MSFEEHRPKPFRSMSVSFSIFIRFSCALLGGTYASFILCADGKGDQKSMYFFRKESPLNVLF